MKHTALALAIFCIALAACARPAVEANTAEPASGPAPAPDAARNADAASPAPKEARPTYEFYLLPRDGKPVQDPRIVSTQRDHPCGPIDLVRVSSIPMNDPVFVPAFVVEFDDAGSEIAKWGIPSEAEVTALQGKRLKFKTEGNSFWVDTNGELEPDAAPSDPDKLFIVDGMLDCPVLPTFKASEAEQCFRVKDDAGTERKLSMEGVCS